MTTTLTSSWNRACYGLALALTLVLVGGSAVRAGTTFVETFEGYTPGSYLYGAAWYDGWGNKASNPNTTPPFYTDAHFAPLPVGLTNPWYGTARVFEDYGGTGTTPSVPLFGGTGSSFLNLINASVGVNESYAPTVGYAINFYGSMRDADPANPFDSSTTGAGMNFELNIRQTAVGARDGLSIRFYNGGTLTVWEGIPSAPSQIYTTSSSGIGNINPFSLEVIDDGEIINFIINGTPLLPSGLATTYGAANAGYISFGTAYSGYNAVKFDTIGITAVPEPTTAAAVGLALAGLTIRRRRRA